MNETQEHIEKLTAIKMKIETNGGREGFKFTDDELALIWGLFLAVVNPKPTTLNFEGTTVTAVNFLVTHDDLEILAIGYFRERLSHEYESWAMGASGFAPTTQEWFDYHFAGFRLDAIREIISAKKMQKAKEWAESAWLHDNRPDSSLWKQFKGIATAPVPPRTTLPPVTEESL